MAGSLEGAAQRVFLLDADPDLADDLPTTSGNRLVTVLSPRS
jgi:hypothetical protein